MRLPDKRANRGCDTDLCLGLLAFLAVLQVPAVLPAQLPPDEPVRPTEAPEAPPAPEPPPAVEYASPYAAFDAGAYDRALDEFADRQTRRPDDPELSLNVGAAHYRMKDFESADAQFSRAAALGEDELRAQALYNLGNSAYRQGRLGEAIDYYMASLEVNPDDLDAKFNLEFVREELKRQQEQQQQQQGENEQGENEKDQDDQAGQQSDDQDQGGGEQPEDQGGDGDDGRDESGDEQPEGGEGPQDSDGDGLDDDLERGGENPTDPQNPDSDSDGLPDGQEDRNRNGRVDPGETDPNRLDSDGDGVPDAADSPPEGDGSDTGDQAGPGQLPQGMTPEEAERYLQALEEGRPDPNRRGQRGRRIRQAKDW